MEQEQKTAPVAETQERLSKLLNRNYKNTDFIRNVHVEYISDAFPQQNRMIKTICRINQIPLQAAGILDEVHSEQKSGASFPDTTRRLASLFQASPDIGLTGTLWRVRLRILRKDTLDTEGECDHGV